MLLLLLLLSHRLLTAVWDILNCYYVIIVIVVCCYNCCNCCDIGEVVADFIVFTMHIEVVVLRCKDVVVSSR